MRRASLVLVVDDGADNRTLLRATLERAGYRAMVAEDGPAALRALDEVTPELILLDYSMPGMDGPEVARRIRAREPGRRTPIVVLTASSDDDHIDQAFAAGVDDYMAKPFDRRILLARVDAMIRASAAQARAAERDHMLSDMEEAAKVQQAQVATLPMCWSNGTVMGAVVPCRRLGGDLLQVFTRGDEVIVVVIDVSGHGTAAALVASAVVTELRAGLRHGPLAEVLGEVNRNLTKARSEHYACIAALRLTATEAEIVNAGLPPVCVLRGGRIHRCIEASGVPPGMLAGSTYESTTIELLDGDRIVAVSDGLTEGFGSADDLMPCLTRLGLLQPSGMRTSEDIGRDIRRQFEHATLEDDATIVMVDRW